jgi:hypothetical protein
VERGRTHRSFQPTKSAHILSALPSTVQDSMGPSSGWMRTRLYYFFWRTKHDASVENMLIGDKEIGMTHDTISYGVPSGAHPADHLGGFDQWTKVEQEVGRDDGSVGGVTC